MGTGHTSHICLILWKRQPRWRDVSFAYKGCHTKDATAAIYLCAVVTAYVCSFRERAFETAEEFWLLTQADRNSRTSTAPLYYNAGEICIHRSDNGTPGKAAFDRSRRTLK